ncbi:MAG: hypothetical protein HXN40_07930 [Prevotella histicola]|uniref:hypothetical protein n=1 Tax=Prevotella histicola TaxID=470565 RepID=UPI001CB4CB15|nr:hypothetical protein [Prevotella histicola]MBF1423489.1 hypothetical protein [Prevotella histicola]MBS6663000.1 hypothetical protein [Prevotella histicola]
MVTKAVFIDYSWERKKIGFTECKDISWCLLCPSGDDQQGHSAAIGGTIRGQYALTSKLLCAHFTLSLLPYRCQYVHISQSVYPHTAKDPTEKGNGSSALYLIIYSLFRRISASIAKTIVLTILRFLDFAFAR